MKVADYITIISSLVAAEMAIGHGTIKLTDAIPDAWVPRVQAWCNILAGLGSLMVTALSRYAGVILLALLLVPSMAGAQDRNVAPGRQITLPIPLSRPDGPSPGAQSLLDKPFQDLANFIGDDIDAAITLSTKIPSLQDGNGQQCLMALKTFGEVVAAHPAPLTFKIASDLEAFRLKQMAINRLCSNQSCTVVFADITQTITALSPMPLPIPSLHDLCSKVPTITVVTPVPTTQP